MNFGLGIWGFGLGILTRNLELLNLELKKWIY
jgi:hypothetical protein